MLRPDEVPTVNMPTLGTQVTLPAPRRVVVRHLTEEKRLESEELTVCFRSCTTTHQMRINNHIITYNSKGQN